MSKGNVIILSGGLDSTVLLYHIINNKPLFGEPVAVSFDYGQRHFKEIEYASQTAKRQYVKHHIINLHRLSEFLSTSALVNPDEKIPTGHYTEESLEATIVPNRNMIMLSIATAIAIKHKAEFVLYGAHKDDHGVYPDCRPDFIKAMSYTINLCDNSEIKMLAPFMEKTKAQIVNIGNQLQVPFEGTWSCYVGGTMHCGECSTCHARKEAFNLNHIKDPTKYLK